MYKFMNDCKGAISIFLVIVLVPMLALSSIFVDMSRLKLAKSVAESSGELTLNTALTNYDAVLKDMYGLFAASQNTDELFSNLETYYRQCIEAAGVAEADADDYVAQIMQFLKSETGTDDLLNMNLTSFEVAKPEEGSLANPAVLKSQIVEFMKYRAPINLGSSIFDAINSMKNLKKQMETVDNKNKFYDQRSDIMEKLEEAWNKLEDYQYRDAYPADGHGFPNGSYMQDYADKLNDHADRYNYLKNAIAYTVRYLYYADADYTQVAEYSVSVNLSPSDNSQERVWTVNQTSNDAYSIDKEPKRYTVSDLKAALETTYKAIKAISKITEEYQIIAQENLNLSDTEKIRIVSAINKILNSGYHKDIKNMVAGIVELINAMNVISADEISDIWVVDNGDSLSYYDASTDESETNKPSGAIKLSSFIQTQINSHLTVDESTGKLTDQDIIVYNALISRVREYYNDTYRIVEAAKNYVKTYTESAKKYAEAFYRFLKEKIKKIEEATNILAVVKSELENSGSAYNKALNVWKDSANGILSDTMGINDISEIENIEKMLTAEKVNKLIMARVNAVKTALETAKANLEGFKILDKEWYKLDEDGAIGYLTLKKLLTNAQKNSIEGVGKSDEFQTEIVNGITGYYDKAYDAIITVLQSTIITKPIKASWSASEAANSPDLIKNQPELFTWLYNNFFDANKAQSKYGVKRDIGVYTDGIATVDSTEIADHRDDADISLQEGEDKAEEYNDKTVPSGTEPNRRIAKEFLPSGEWSDILKSIEENGATSNDANSMLSNSTSTLSSLDGLFDLVKTMATELRDDLYVTNYIMNMFSYSTFESEITKKNKTSIDAFESWYEFQNDKYELKSQFNKEALAKDARTLTRVSINPNANYLYGKEIEYIVYGEGGVGKTYGTIYMLRFALNTVYAFIDAEIGNITTAAATALFGTPPLTPLIPVAKIAMTIGLSLAESAYDLYQLKSGDKVSLMKSRDTWIMKPSSAGKAIAGKALEAVNDYVIDEGFKVLNNVMEMTNDELDKLINEGTAGIEKLAHAATESTINSLKNYGNAAIQKMVDICNNINNQLMEKIGYEKGQTQEKINMAMQQIDAWLDTQGSSESDLVYLAKKTAVIYLKQNGGEVIGKLFDALENVIDNAASEMSRILEETLDDIQAKIDSKIDSLAETAGNALYDMKNKCIDRLKEAAANGVESLKASLKEQISASFGTSSSVITGTDSVVSSLLSWAYSDYLQLFVLMGMVLSPETILLRTADAIELNMQQIDGELGFIETDTEIEVSRLWGLIKYIKKDSQTVANTEAYKLNKAYTYLNIKATIDVKPLMLTLPLIATTVKDQLDGSNWYQVTYEGKLGY